MQLSYQQITHLIRLTITAKEDSLDAMDVRS